jgi:hypothetical protein
MRKGVSYIIVLVLLAAALFLLYSSGPKFTGYTVLSEYENQTSCEDANYTWQETIEQNCTTITTCINETVDCEPCLEYEDLNGTQGDCINWSSCIEENCTDEEECVDIVIGGQCIGNVCGTDFLELCLNEIDCTGAGGYWYNNVCNVEEESSCSNDLSLCLDETNCTEVGGGYWYDDVCNAQEEEIEEEEEEETVEGTVLEETPSIPLFDSSEILPLSLNPGSSRGSTVIIKNTGEIPLSSCILKLMGGEFDSWISIIEETINIKPGEQYEFSFNVAVPEQTEEGSYSLKVATLCSNIFKLHNFVVNVVEKKLEFDLISADRTRDDRVRVIYSLQELSGEDQDVELGFSLLNENNQEVANALENQSIGANAIEEFRTNIEINESLLPVNGTTNETIESELTLVANFNSQIYSSSVREKIILGAPIGGFAIFAGVGAGEAIVFVIVLFVLVFILVFARRMRKKGKTLKDLFKSESSEPA